MNNNNKNATGHVLAALRASESIEDFTRDYAGSFVEASFTDYLHSLLEARGVKKYTAIKASGLADSYAFQIFQGRKKPSRDKILALAAGMELSLEECQRLLHLAGVNELYAKNRRDAIIIFGLERRLGVTQINDVLFDMEEHTL